MTINYLMKKLVIAGGSGFIGKALTEFFKNDFDSIVILSRNKNHRDGKINYVQWDAFSMGDWCTHLEEATAVINLSGKSVDCRFTKKNKQLIFSSRIDSTKIIGEAILKCSSPPLLWINASSAALYPDSETEEMSENSNETGTGFMADVTTAWEKVVKDTELSSTRKIYLRTTLVFDNSEGVLPVLMGLAKKGIGGTLGTGSQQVSWIHIEDFCRIIKWMIENENAEGAYNMASPEPVTNKKLTYLIRKKVNAFLGLPSPEWLLKIGAFFMRTEPEMILSSRYVVPQRLLQEGFVFKYTTIEECLE
ncbi:MAG: hypothetical protein JWO32_2566 [Bacteroidetes bacterium]|nr:hypothetical protein [Bacteroidota bacterium]